jgi:hypothetical protein
MHQAIFLTPLPGTKEEYFQRLKKTSRVNLAPASYFSGAVAGEEVEDFCEGSFLHTHPLLCLLFCFTLFILPASFYQKPKKN